MSTPAALPAPGPAHAHARGCPLTSAGQRHNRYRQIIPCHELRYDWKVLWMRGLATARQTRGTLTFLLAISPWAMPTAEAATVGSTSSGKSARAGKLEQQPEADVRVHRKRTALQQRRPFHPLQGQERELLPGLRGERLSALASCASFKAHPCRSHVIHKRQRCPYAGLACS
jgi:hypothetical protein